MSVPAFRRPPPIRRSRSLGSEIQLGQPSGSGGLSHNTNPMIPKLAVLCDYAVISQDGKLSILGIFSDLAAPGFPTLVAPFFLVSSWEAGPSEFETQKVIKVMMLAEDGAQLGTLEQSIAIQRPGLHGRPAIINHVIRLEGLLIPAAGSYQFALHIGDDPKTDVSLHVHGPG